MDTWLQVLVTAATSALVQLAIGIAILSAMRQQLIDLIGWVKGHDNDLHDLARGQREHEGRLSHVEGRLGIPREGAGKELR